MNDPRIAAVEKRIAAIEQRNLRVESDKAWETSAFRMFTVAVITYAVAFAVLWSIGANDPAMSAFVPAFGFILSVQSLPMAKKWWIGKSIGARMQHRDSDR